MASTAADHSETRGDHMQIALALYPNFTMLDIVGPFQVLADVPGNDVVFVAAQAGQVVDHTGRAGLVATKSFADIPAPEVVVVPGGLGDTELQAELVEWLRAVHPTTTWTTSVCTGAIYLAAAGILDGVDATTHWARKGALEKLGGHYTLERVVERGKVITAAGVSSGIDMALVLLDRINGRDMAEMIQLAIEYDPQPPFDAGSPAKAPAALVDFVQQMMGEGPALPAASNSGGA
jgi:transcriptional regulator GlxA family with amidase domain